MTKKGFTLVEMLVTFAILAVIVVVMTNILFKVKETAEKTTAITEIQTFQSNVSRRILKDLNEYKLTDIESCGENCYNFHFEDLGIKELSFSGDVFSYGDYVKTLPKGSYIAGNFEMNNTTVSSVSSGDDSVFSLYLPIKNQYNNKNYNINISFQYNSSEAYFSVLPAQDWVFEVTIPTGGDTFSFGAANADLTIDWGDDNETTHIYSGDNYISHSYLSSGVYDVSLSGTSDHITFCDLTSAWCNNTTPEYLTDIKTKIPSSIGLTDASYMFANIEVASFTAIDFFDEASSNITDMRSIFQYSAAFNHDISGWDTSNVINMSNAFYCADNFNQDIGSWDISSVNDMSFMFDRAYAFNQDIGSWDTSNVTDMCYMFKDTTSFNQNIGSWNTSSLTDMGGMFRGTDSFNQNIGGWDTSNVTRMSQLFLYNDSFNQPIGNWDTSSVTNMDNMFAEATNFNQDLSGWCVSNISIQPEDFDYNTPSWSLPKPVWGTCP